MESGSEKEALFPPWTNTVLRVVLACLVLGAAFTFTFLFIFVRSPLYTGQFEPVTQPIEFDHRHHVGDAGIDCRFCHSTVETAATAGFPSTEVCMGCHNQIWNQSPLLQSVRASFYSGRPLVWRRVHELPDFAYFNHSIHVNKGVGCVTCHGRIDQMPAVMQQSPLTMSWCLDCHRDPKPNLRPHDRITDLAWQPSDPQATGDRVATNNHLHTRTSCTTCHR